MNADPDSAPRTSWNTIHSELIQNTDIKSYMRKERKKIVCRTFLLSSAWSQSSAVKKQGKLCGTVPVLKASFLNKIYVDKHRRQLHKLFAHRNLKMQWTRYFSLNNQTSVLCRLMRFQRIRIGFWFNWVSGSGLEIRIRIQASQNGPRNKGKKRVHVWRTLWRLLLKSELSFWGLFI